MSRYRITVIHESTGQTDSDGAIGYDRPLQTLFVHGFIDGRRDRTSTGRRVSELWLGGMARAYPQDKSGLHRMLSDANSKGYAINIPESLKARILEAHDEGASE